MSEKTKELSLNPRQRKFLKFYIQTGNASLSAKKAGYLDCITNPYKILENARFQAAYQHLLDKEGITDKKLLRVLSEGLEAKKLVYVESGDETDKQGNPKKVQEFDDDYATRHKYLETGLKLRTHIQEKEGESAPVQVVHVYLPSLGKVNDTNHLEAAPRTSRGFSLTNGL